MNNDIYSKVMDHTAIQEVWWEPFATVVYLNNGNCQDYNCIRLAVATTEGTPLKACRIE